MFFFLFLEFCSLNLRLCTIHKCLLCISNYCIFRYIDFPDVIMLDYQPVVMATETNLNHLLF